jgi:hypothetical protein
MQLDLLALEKQKTLNSKELHKIVKQSKFIFYIIREINKKHQAISLRLEFLKLEKQRNIASQNKIKENIGMALDYQL